MLTKKHLKNIASTSSGYSFRGKINPSDDGNIYVVQAKDINNNEYIENKINLTKTLFNIERSNSFLKYNDVILTSRAAGISNFRSTVYKIKDDNIVAASSVNIIRIKDKNVLAEYLALYLNSIEGQRLLSQIVLGSQIQIILRKDLDELEIPIPSIDKQRLLIKLNENIRHQEKIINKISRLNYNIFTESLSKSTNNKEMQSA